MSSIRPFGPRALADDPRRLEELFGRSDLLPLWIAEPYLEVAEPVQRALADRAATGWYGYEARPTGMTEAFWAWMERRHGWTDEGLTTTVSPSVGTSIGVLIDQHSEPGDGVVLQPPVFTDFKPLVTRAGRRVVKNPLIPDGSGYRMDLDDLAEVTRPSDVRVLILCNPHNPVGRVWTADELAGVAAVCAANDVVVIADEIHADLALPPHTFTPFAGAASGSGVRWGATHGPIKTFGLAGVCDTLLISPDEDITARFRDASSRFHLTRNNVFGLAAFEAAYRDGDDWVDGMLSHLGRNLELLRTDLPEPLRVSDHQATYLAWIDFRGLDLDVPALGQWIVDAGLALSPGHWFGREGAGFARLSIAAPEPMIREAIGRLRSAIDSD